MSDVMMQNLVADLEKNNVEVDKLCVAICASEQYIGELLEYYDEGAAPVRVVLKNPRRILRIQKVSPGNVAIDVIVLDIDLVSAGTMTFWPVGFYKLSDISEDSRVRMLAMLARYFKSLEMQRAAESGIVIPTMETPPNFAEGLRKVT